MQEIELPEPLPIVNNGVASPYSASVHVDHEFIAEPNLTRSKEAFKLLHEFRKNQITQLGLHLRGELLVQVEFFDDQIEVKHKGIADSFCHTVVKTWVNMKWFVRLFNLLDPPVQAVHFGFDKGIK